MKKPEYNTVGQIVVDDHRAAGVFDRYGIDYCCHGHHSLDEACAAAKVDPREVANALAALPPQNPDNESPDFAQWPLDGLCDYIVETHHHYVSENIPVLRQHLDKICTVHGERHPELFEIRALFAESAEELALHMKKEEKILFPHIRKMMADAGSGHPAPPVFGTIHHPIRMMMADHDHEGARFERIAALSNRFAPPDDACNTYRMTFERLQDFVEDLHRHIHLENNILFPKSLELESQLYTYHHDTA